MNEFFFWKVIFDTLKGREAMTKGVGMIAAAACLGGYRPSPVTPLKTGIPLER